MAFGWQGAKTRLVPLDRDKHLDNCVQWFNDPEVTRWVLLELPLTRLAEEQFFEHASKSSDREVFFAVETIDGEHIGMTVIHEIDFRHGFGMTGLVIGRRDRWGQGLATDAVRTRSEYIFDVLGLRRVLTKVFAENVAIRRVLAKAGYTEVGRLPALYWKRGRYRDMIELMATRAAWEAVR